jgi:hypothetical protein
MYLLILWFDEISHLQQSLLLLLSAKKILVLWEGGQNHKKHIEVQYFREYDFFFYF